VFFVICVYVDMFLFFINIYIVHKYVINHLFGTHVFI
jgi:hypothetical protein